MAMPVPSSGVGGGHGGKLLKVLHLGPFGGGSLPAARTLALQANDELVADVSEVICRSVSW